MSEFDFLMNGWVGIGNECLVSVRNKWLGLDWWWMLKNGFVMDA